MVDKQFISLNANGYPAELKVALSYIDFPLLIGYTFGGEKLHPYLLGGLQIGVPTKQDITLTLAEDTRDYISRDQPRVDFEGIEYGIIGEFGIRKYLSGTKIINISFRYIGSERTMLINNTSISGGAANLGTSRYVGSIGLLFRL